MQIVRKRERENETKRRAPNEASIEAKRTWETQPRQTQKIQLNRQIVSRNKFKFQVFYLSETMKMCAEKEKKRKQPESLQLLPPDMARLKRQTRIKRNPYRVRVRARFVAYLPAYPNKGPARPTEVTSLLTALRRAQSTENAEASDTASV